MLISFHRQDRKPPVPRNSVKPRPDPPLTDLTLPASARRFASFLDREYCVWMPTASVALLAALITGKGRPKRLLVPENAPAFISNIGLITGAAPVKVSPPQIASLIEGLLGSEGLSPNQIWGVATHREGQLSPTEWLSRCAESGIPTIELCTGSLFPLARWGKSPALFTIVDLDAEKAFAGAHLAALLTSDRASAVRVQRLCLPGPDAQDYVLNALPRGLAQDEPALAALVERVTAQGGAPSSAGTPAFSPGGSSRAPAIEDEKRWRARLAEIEARQDEALRTAAANAASLHSRLEQQLSLAEEWQRRFRQAESEAASRAERDAHLLSETRKKLEEQRRTIDQWEARFEEAEAEFAKDAEVVSGARAELSRQKSEFEQALASIEAERTALAQKLLRAERERDLAVGAAGQRDESERRALSELRLRVEQFEKAAAAAADREARQAAAGEASRAHLNAQIARLEAEAAAFAPARADLVEQKAAAEQALASSLAEKQALSRKLEELDAELGEALADAAKRAAAQRAALDEASQRATRLEKEIETLNAGEEARAREREAARGGLSGRIAALEAEKEALGARLSTAESGRERALAEAGRREAAERSAAEAQRARADRLEAEAAALKERAARLTEEWTTARAALEEQVRGLQAEMAAAREADERLRGEKEGADRALAEARSEARAASEKLLESERGHALALAEAARNRDALQASLAERITRLEADFAFADHSRAELLIRNEEGEKARALLHSERDALARKLEDAERERDRARLEAEKRGEALRTAREEQERGEAPQWESQRAEMSERMARLEAAAREAEDAHAEQVRRMGADTEREVASIRAEAVSATRKLAEAEKDRDLARAEGVSREKSHQAALEEQRRRADQLERDAASRTEREMKLTDQWALQRAGLSDKILRLEAAAVAAKVAHNSLAAQKAEGDQALASTRAEKEALDRKMEGMANELAVALSEAGRRDEAQGLALDEERRRAEHFERLAASFAEREAQWNREFEAARSDWAERIRGAEDAAAAARTAQADLLGRKNEAERALGLLQAERETLSVRLQQIELDHDLTGAEAARREEARYAELVGQKNEAERALGLLQAERETLAARLQQIERDHDLTGAEAARREEGHRAELLEQTQLAERLKAKLEAALASGREAKPVETGDGSRAELVARIARLEAAEAIADKARNELLSRKRDSDRALSEAQAERAALLKKLAAAEHDRDQAQAALAGLAVNPQKPPIGVAPPKVASPPAKPVAPPAKPVAPPAKPATPPDPREAAGERNTGGLSALVSLWNTAIIRRPARSKETGEKPAEPSPSEVFGIEEITEEPMDLSVPAPVAEEKSKPVSPVPPVQRNTGGLSALVQLWTTAKTMRPFRRKEVEEKSSEAAVNPVLGMEEVSGDASPPSISAPVASEPSLSKPPAPAAAPPGITPGKPPMPSPVSPGTAIKPPGPAPAARARPNPPRRPEPKPDPVPDETEKLGGWLRGLAGRMTKKK
jgi:chromosome segregation ATPase